jgi:hypothetical protein
MQSGMTSIFFDFVFVFDFSLAGVQTGGGVAGADAPPS